MIVCVCRRVSDRAVLAAMAAGARSLADVARATGAGTSCGCCRGTIEALLAAVAPAPCSASPCAGCPRAPVWGSPGAEGPAAANNEAALPEKAVA
jgi:bacterioferritin-associated ferredoxin